MREKRLLLAACRAKEATNINLSLLMLGNVVSKLAERSNPGAVALSTRSGDMVQCCVDMLWPPCCRTQYINGPIFAFGTGGLALA